MAGGTGLREAKKQRTREHIAAVATQLFVTQGFEQTTIAQIAEEAGVAKMTVTNYFPVKEDLLFDRAPEIVPFLADAVATRPAGTSPARAVRHAYERRLGQRWPALAITGRPFFALVETSPTLRARGRQMLAEQEEALATVLVTEACGPSGPAADPEVADAAVRARLLAARIAGGVRMLWDEARRRVLGGEDVETVVTAMTRVAALVFDDLEGPATDPGPHAGSPAPGSATAR